MTDIEGIAPPPQGGLQPLALRAMFWRPEFLAASPWLEHIPVAFWLVEAQRPRVIVELGPGDGTAYFAFCQAVDRLGLDTRCFAAAWPADERGDAEAEAALTALRDHNDARYSSFSRLVAGDRDEVLDQFTDGTVDLLHVAGRHSHAALSLLLQQWRPKLSPRALVVLHHANSHGRRGGARRVVEELARTRPAFDFAQGEGVAIVGVGEHLDALPARLFAAGRDEVVRRSVQDVFSRLGRACSEAWLAQVEQARSRDLARQLAERQAELDDARDALAEAREDLRARAPQRPAGDEAVPAADIAALEQRFAQARAERDELERALHAAREELAGLRGQADGDLRGECEALRAEVARLTAARQAADDKEAVLLRLRGEAEKRAADEIRQLRERHDALQAEVASLTEALAAGRAAQQASLDETGRRADEALAGLREKLGERVVALVRSLAPNPAAAEPLESEGADPEALLGALDQAATDIGQLRTHLQGARNRNRTLEAERDQLGAQLQAARKRGDELEAASARHQQAAAAAAKRADELAAEWAAAAREHARERSEVAHRTEATVAALEADVARLTAALAERDAAAADAGARLAAADAARLALVAAAEADAAEVRRSAERIAGMDAELARVRADHDAIGETARNATARAERLAAELEASRDACAALEARAAAAESELGSARSLLDERATALDAARQAQVAADDALETGRARAEALARDNEELQRQHGELRATLQRAATMLKALKDENAALAAAAEASARDHAAALAAATQAHAQALEAALAAAAQENAQARATLQREADAALAGQRAELEARSAAAVAALGQRHAAELTAAVARHENESAQQAEALARTTRELEARFRETGTLSALLLETETQVEALKSRLAALESALAEADRREARQRDLGTALAAALRGRDETLRQREAELQARDAELAMLRRSPSWRLTAPLRVIGRPFRGAEQAADGDEAAPPAAPTDPHADLLRESPLMDAAWYLQAYPDVAAAGVDPAEHYLQFGAVEGRDPGPEFDTVGYLRANPDVAAAGLNPLVHYLLFGRDEGRAVR